MKEIFVLFLLPRYHNNYSHLQTNMIFCHNGTNPKKDGTCGACST
jgi:hypothetical protein